MSVSHERWSLELKPFRTQSHCRVNCAGTLRLVGQSQFFWQATAAGSCGEIVQRAEHGFHSQIRLRRWEFADRSTPRSTSVSSARNAVVGAIASSVATMS